MANRDRYLPDYDALVKTLVAQRKRAGLTQVELARLMGTTQSIVSKYERKEVLLDVLDFVRYCLAIGVDPGNVLKSTNWSLEALVQRTGHGG